MKAEDDLTAHLERFTDNLKRIDFNGSSLAPNEYSREAVGDLILIYRSMFGGSGQDYGKAHTEITFPPGARGSIVPLEHFNEINLMNPLLQRTSLYSRRTAFIRPIDVVGRDLFLYGTQLDTLLLENKMLLPLVQAGRCIVLPRKLTIVFDYADTWDRSSHGRYSVAAPLLQGDAAEYTPLNKVRFRPSAADDVLIFKQFLLPYYPNVSADKLAKIADDESDAFVRFVRWLTEKVAELASHPESTDIRQLLEEIEAGVASLVAEARKLATSRVFQGIKLSFFTMSLAALLAGQAQALGDVAGIAGAVSLMDILRDEVGRRDRLADFKQSEMYLPLLISKADGRFKN